MIGSRTRVGPPTRTLGLEAHSFRQPRYYLRMSKALPMLQRDPQDPASADIDVKSLIASAHADTRSGPKFVLLSPAEEAWLRRLDSDDLIEPEPNSS